MKRNGEIDLLRFIFSCVIALKHINDSFSIGLFGQGAFAVEFFFMVSGYFLADSVYREIKRNPDPVRGMELTRNTWKYVFKKIRSFYCAYVLSIFLQIVILYIIIERWNILSVLTEIVKGIPVFTLTFMAINSRNSLYLGGTWYLSAMVVSIIVLYPVLRKYYYHAARIILPIIGAIGISYIYVTYRSLFIWNEWVGGISVGLIRGFSEMCIGIFLFEAARYLSEFAKKHKVWVQILQILFLLISIGYAVSNIDPVNNIYYFFVLVAGLLFCFAGGGVIPDTRVTRSLGKYSLYLYITHGIIRYSAVRVLGRVISKQQVVILGILMVVLSLAVMFLSDLIMKRIHKRPQHSSL